MDNTNAFRLAVLPRFRGAFGETHEDGTYAINCSPIHKAYYSYNSKAILKSHFPNVRASPNPKLLDRNVRVFGFRVPHRVRGLGKQTCAAGAGDASL